MILFYAVIAANWKVGLIGCVFRKLMRIFEIRRCCLFILLFIIVLVLGFDSMSLLYRIFESSLYTCLFDLYSFSTNLLFYLLITEEQHYQ